MDDSIFTLPSTTFSLFPDCYQFVDTSQALVNFVNPANLSQTKEEAMLKKIFDIRFLVSALVLFAFGSSIYSLGLMDGLFLPKKETFEASSLDELLTECQKAAEWRSKVVGYDVKPEINYISDGRVTCHIPALRKSSART
jgi:hypothetical protein